MAPSEHRVLLMSHTGVVIVIVIINTVINYVIIDVDVFVKALVSYPMSCKL